MSTYYQGYKIRIYPTPEQEKRFYDHIHGCRFLWNQFIAIHNERHANGEQFLSLYDMNKLIPELKEKYPWLNDVDNGSLQKVSGMVSRAFDKFFEKKARHPTFHSKKDSKHTYPVRDDRFYILKDYMQIPSIGHVKYASDDYDFPYETYTHRTYKICNVRVTKILHNNKWVVTFNIERESQTLPLNDYTMGIDLGLVKLATVKTENSTYTIKNVNNSERMKKAVERRKRDQRRVERKQYRMYQKTLPSGDIVYEPSKNWEKAMNKLRRDYAYEANVRKDHIHKETTRLVNHLPKQVVMEDLHVEKLKRDKFQPREISTACWSTFTEIMRYKCENRGIDFKLVPDDYPSSKTCSNCGFIHKDLKLTPDRLFVCPNCGFIIDRDENAAVNLRDYYKDEK